MRGFLQDLQYAVRQLRRTRGFTVLAVLTLGLGIGVQTASFAIVKAVIARVVPFAGYADIYEVGLQDLQKSVNRGIPADQFRLVEADRPETASGIAGVGWDEPMTVTAPGHADSVTVEPVTGQFAQVFGLRAQAGRWLTRDDDRPNAAPAAIIDDRLWHEWFAGDPAVTGRAVVRINRQPFTVVGVARPQFRGVLVGLDTPEVWIADAISSLPSLHPLWPKTYRQYHALTVFARTSARGSPAELRDRIQPIIKGGWSGFIPYPAAVTVTPAATAQARPTLVLERVVLLLSALVLLAACANLANMLYARGTQREGELAVRLSLGAKPSRLLRLLLAEAAVLGILAAGVGLVIGLASLRLFSHTFPTFMLGWHQHVSLDLSPDYRVFLYALLIGLASALCVGMATAFRASRIAPLRAMAAAGAAGGITRRARLRTVAVAVQVTTALILVIGAGLFLENPPPNLDLDRRLHFDPSQVATAGLDLSLQGSASTVYG